MQWCYLVSSATLKSTDTVTASAVRQYMYIMSLMKVNINSSWDLCFSSDAVFSYTILVG
jgi:hypothetical protein